MSTSEGAVSGQGSPPERKAFLRDGALPASDGGGVVFPAAFDGPGFRLNEWEYLRYVARVVEYEDSLAETRTSGQKNMPAIMLFVLLLAFGSLMSAATRTGLVNVHWLATVVLLIVFAAVAYGPLAGMISHPVRFRSAYPGAERLGYFTLWRQRVLSSVVTSKNWKQSRCYWPLLHIALLLYWTIKILENPQIGWLPTALAVTVLAYKALSFGAFFGTYLAICYRFGRAPRPEDLQPI